MWLTVPEGVQAQEPEVASPSPEELVAAAVLWFAVALDE
eukprot:CAMPEP_0172684236 /NCGR_PEP_ID=MMETSP1074-20121228/19420_1 /TAXON_ID=2916 /ORGANISM="Ceratium fusus, Strain PA161109" /LENGTH=38 /DNA_ID= /DNA_START= /DNA_END= /DNA_ORIENTATION=